MKRKIKRLWKLYQELRRLRRVNKEIVEECNKANDRLAAADARALRLGDYALSLEEKLKRRGHRLLMSVPNTEAIISPYAVNPYTEKSRAQQVEQKMTDLMKIHLIDSLLEQGWLKKTQVNNFETVYSLWLVEE